MKTLLATARAIDAVNERIGRVACWLTLAVVLVATANAILRYGFRLGTNGLLELQWYMFALIFLFGAAFTLARWPIKAAIPLAFALLTLQGVSEIIKRVAFLRGLAPAPVQRRELQ